MNEFEERRGQSPFYAIMAILTLVVAAVGATFAYFSLQASNNSVSGSVAKVGLSMSVTPLSTEATGDLIPLKQELLQNAVTGETGKSSCIDKNGNTVCKIYKVVVTNEGNTATTVDGKITFEFGEETLIKNLKWQKMTSATVPSSDMKSAYGTVEVPADTAFVTGATIEATTDSENKSTVEYYLMIWLHDINDSQNDQDYGSFTGTIEFTGSDGSGITGTFTVAGSGEDDAE